VYNEAKEVGVMLKAYQFRLYPNQEQKIYFANCFGSARFVYNQMLADRKEIYETYKDDKELLRSIKPRTYTSFKEEFPFLKEVEPTKTSSATSPLVFRTSKPNTSQMPPTPPITKAGTSASKTAKSNCRRLVSSKLSSTGTSMGLIKSCTLSMNKAGNYFISILVEQEAPQWLPAEHKIGIDLGIADFAITTNDAGESVKHANPKCLYQSEKKVKKAQRALSRKQKGSKNRDKARLVLAKKYEKIANQRKHFLHKLSNKITDENQVIVIETLSSSQL
jgi:putative transposase